jgi:hypothetical protein
MIEQQQVTITNGLRQMYYKLLNNDLWEGPALQEENGHPLTHDILDGLGILQSSSQNDTPARFVDNLEEEEERLFRENGALAGHRRKISHDSASSGDEYEKTDRRDSRFKSRHIGSASSTPQLRTSSISSASSAKRGPETPPSELSSPTHQPKRLRDSNFKQAQTILQTTFPQLVASPSPSPEQLEFGYYEMLPVASPMDSSPYLVSNYAFNSYQTPVSLAMDQNFAGMQDNSFTTVSNTSLTTDPLDSDPAYQSFFESTANNVNRFKYLTLPSHQQYVQM